MREQPVPARMRAAVITAPRRLEVHEVDTPAPAGFLGLLVTQLAVRAGARVIAISQRAWSLELARQMGARETIELGPDDGAIVRRVEELTGGAGCDRAIELVGGAAPARAGGDAVPRPRPAGDPMTGRPRLGSVGADEPLAIPAGFVKALVIP